ncbi:hypothetical protein CKY51_11300 [Xanthomonas maliensis]|nr:hypothetical protein CKY51_11300 [Xanthomonas maliensis]
MQYLLLARYTANAFRRHPYVAARLETPAPLHQQAFAAWSTTVPDDVWQLGRPLWEVIPAVSSTVDATDRLNQFGSTL